MRFSDFQGRPNIAANHQVATIGSSAQTLSAAGVTIHANTVFVRIAAELADIRYVLHGSTNPDPTTNTGEILYDGDGLLLSRAQFDTAIFKRNAGTDAKLQVSQFIQ